MICKCPNCGSMRPYSFWHDDGRRCRTNAYQESCDRPHLHWQCVDCSATWVTDVREVQA